VRVYDELLHADWSTSELCLKAGFGVCLSWWWTEGSWA
jgi:hypothetical protein